MNLTRRSDGVWTGPAGLGLLRPMLLTGKRRVFVLELCRGGDPLLRRGNLACPRAWRYTAAAAVVCPALRRHYLTRQETPNMVDEKDPNDETPETPEATEGAVVEQTEGKVSDEDLDNAAGGKVFQ
jgi:hypothetical protein